MEATPDPLSADDEDAQFVREQWIKEQMQSRSVLPSTLTQSPLLMLLCERAPGLETLLSPLLSRYFAVWNPLSIGLDDLYLFFFFLRHL